MYISRLKIIFSGNRDKETAEPMERYMKKRFPFLGIKTPERKLLLQQFYKETGILQEENLPESFIRDAWALPEREYHYAALTVLARQPGWIEEKHLPLLEELITTNAWWDSVDTLATAIVGPFLAHNNELRKRVIRSWEAHDNMWLRRTAVLHQLKYKQDTDEEDLFRIIHINRADDEFFIRKAIGWALREYSKTRPEEVEAFIAKESLSPLSVREGLKHINRNKAVRGEKHDTVEK